VSSERVEERWLIEGRLLGTLCGLVGPLSQSELALAVRITPSDGTARAASASCSRLGVGWYALGLGVVTREYRAAGSSLGLLLDGRSTRHGLDPDDAAVVGPLDQLVVIGVDRHADGPADPEDRIAIPVIGSVANSFRNPDVYLVRVAFLVGLTVLNRVLCPSEPRACGDVSISYVRCG